MNLSLANWNPVRDFDDFFTRISQLPSEQLGRSDWMPPVDISETEDAYQIEIEVPSIPREEINVSVKDGVLTVSGERKFEKATGGKRHRVERRFGKFVRSFRLPEDVQEDSIDATAKEGLLRVAVKKREEVLPRTIEVQVH